MQAEVFFLHGICVQVHEHGRWHVPFVAEYDGDIQLCQFADERRGERCRMVVNEDDGDILDCPERDVVGIVLVCDFEHGILDRKLDGAFEYESLFGHVYPFVSIDIF